MVDEVDQNQAVVDHYAGQRDDAEHRQQADRNTEEPVAEHRADGAERNHRHDQQRLEVGAQRDGDQSIDHEQSEHGSGQ